MGKPHFEIKLRQLMLNRSAKDGVYLTQDALATATGIGRPTINRWCQGRVDRIEPGTLAALMRYFNCEMSDLFEVIDPLKPNDNRR